MTDASILRARVEALEHTVDELRREIRRQPVARASSRVRAREMTVVLLAVVSAVVWVRAEDRPDQLVVGPGGVIVTNAQGRPALTMQSLPGKGGRIAVFNGNGAPVAQLIASGDGCCARLEIFQDGDLDKAKVSVGVSGTMGSIRFRSGSDLFSQISAAGFAIRGESSDDPTVVIRDEGGSGGSLRLRTAAGASALMLNNEDGDGLIRAYGSGGVATVLGSSNGTGRLRLNAGGQAAMLAQSDGLFFTNASGASVMTIGSNTTGGYLVANNKGGQEAATLAVEADGYGRLQLWRAGQLSLIAGTTQGKGDLCVNGTQGSLCMGLLGVKTFTKY